MRRVRGGIFAVAAGMALLFALLALILVVTTTALQAGKISAMQATAAAGLSLSLRTAVFDGPKGTEFVPYIVAAQVDHGSAAEGIGLTRGDAIFAINENFPTRPAELWETIRKIPGGKRSKSNWPGSPKPRKFSEPLRPGLIWHGRGSFWCKSPIFPKTP